MSKSGDKLGLYDFRMDTLPDLRSGNDFHQSPRSFDLNQAHNHAYTHEEVVGTMMLEGREHKVMRNEYGEEVWGLED